MQNDFDRKELEKLGGGFNVYIEGFGFFLCSNSPDAAIPEHLNGKPCQIFPVPKKFVDEKEKHEAYLDAENWLNDERFLLFLDDVEFFPQECKLIATPIKYACFPNELASLHDKWNDAVIRRIIQIKLPADPEPVGMTRLELTEAMDRMRAEAEKEAEDPIKAAEAMAYFGEDF